VTTEAVVFPRESPLDPELRLDTTRISAKEAARKVVNLVTTKNMFSCE
jgi:adenylylsulfate kinase-like enzyme